MSAGLWHIPIIIKRKPFMLREHGEKDATRLFLWVLKMVSQEIKKIWNVQSIKLHSSIALELLSSKVLILKLQSYKVAKLQCSRLQKHQNKGNSSKAPKVTRQKILSDWKYFQTGNTFSLKARARLSSAQLSLAHTFRLPYNRETVTSVWNVAHDWCQLCAQCLLGGGRLYEKTIRKGISPITFESKFCLNFVV